MSNLKNGRSGSFVNFSKINLHLSDHRRCHAEITADRISPLTRAVTRQYLRGEFARVLSTPHALLLAINRSTPSSFRSFFRRLLAAGVLPALAQFVLAVVSRANCFGQKLRLVFLLLPSLIVSLLEVQRHRVTSSSLSPAGASPFSVSRGPVDPVRLCLHRVYLRDHDELLIVKTVSL